MSDVKEQVIIVGSKGKSGGEARQAVEDPDSLSSKALATILDVIGEGEIGGLVDGAKSVFLNDTPLQNADGSFNFQNVILQTRVGTQGQTYIPGFSDAETEYLLSPILVTAAAPVVTSVTNLNSNRVRVTVGVPVLSTQDLSNGDIHGYSVPVLVDVQPNGGGYTNIVNDTISGKTRNRYQRTYDIPLSGTGPWNIKVRRGNTESAVSNIQDALWTDLVTGVISSKLAHPNSALVGIQIDASQFSSIPTRGYDVKLLLVKVPTNYNPVTRVYTGVWDGTFQIAWTDNPAWHFFDITTNPRYGAGDYLATAMDKWMLYTISQYCDELVPDGFGGTEPRFTCNVYLQERADAYKVLNDLASVFRGMVYWSTGTVFASQDAPEDPTMVFTHANIKGDFQYEGSSKKSRHTSIVVQYNDKTNRYRLVPEYVEADPAIVARYGARPLGVVGFGCASRGQANRVGRSILYTEQYESDVISWETGLDATYVRPGQLVKIGDPGRAGKRVGGRIKAATSTSITVDASVVLTTGIAYTLTLVMPDGTLVDRLLTNAPATTAVLTFSSALPSTDLVGAVWVLAESGLALQLVRVLAMTESGPATYKIVGLAHNPGKYALIDNGLKLETVPTSQLSLTPNAVSLVTISQELYIEASTLKVRLIVSWPRSANAVSYKVMWRPADGNWLDLPVTGDLLNHVDDVPTGDYEAKVYAVNALGRMSVPTLGAGTLLGKAAPPADVTGFTAQQNGNVVAFKWNQVADLDLQGYEIRYNDPGESSWDNATPITQVTRGTAVTTAAVPPSPDNGPWNLMIKARDTSGIYSANPAIYPLTVDSTFNVVFSRKGDPDYVGFTFTHMVKHHTGVLVPDSQHLASGDGWETFDQYVPAPYPTCMAEAPEYDQGYDYTFRVWADIVSALGPGETVGFPDVSLEFDYHKDVGSYDGFSPWAIGTALFRFGKQRLVMNTVSGIAKITGYKGVYDAEDVTRGGPVTVQVGGTTVPFGYRYANVPRVKVTCEGTIFRSPTYASLTTQQMVLRVWDAAGTDVGGPVTWETTGV